MGAKPWGGFLPDHISAESPRLGHAIARPLLAWHTDEQVGEQFPDRASDPPIRSHDGAGQCGRVAPLTLLNSDSGSAEKELSDLVASIFKDIKGR